jgi:DNA-binding NarL/FixJ family response regulator
VGIRFIVDTRLPEGHACEGVLAPWRLPEQRSVLLLGVLHGLSHDEIASATGMPLGTVKAHARRGLLKVRTLLLGQEQTQLEEEDA